MIGAELQPVQPRILSWQAWLALAYVILVFPVGWGNLVAPFIGRLFLGQHAALIIGPNWGWYLFWGALAAIECLGCCLCLWAVRSEGHTVREIGLYSARLRFYLSFLFASLVVFSIVLIGKEWGWISTRADDNPVLRLSSIGRHFFFLGLIIIGASCEEIMFRGFAITYLRRLVRSPWFAVVLSTAAFAYMHGGLRQGFDELVSRFVIGLMLAGVYLWRGSLFPAILAHYLIDASFTLLH